MTIGVIADDFTGASDIALTLAEHGLRVALHIGVSSGGAEGLGDSGGGRGAHVVALKSRTAPVGEAVEASLAACDWLLANGATQIVFKVCSTFDSTPEGNIGPVLDALAKRLDAETTVVCPAFPENGRSVYQGHLFVADTLLSESGMRNHPLTPMTDPDLRRVLAAQSQMPVGHVPAAKVNSGAAVIRQALTELTGHVIVDAIRDCDLREIGVAARDFRLLCGGSGIALGLPANFGASPRRPDWRPVSGRGVILSGSCSEATLGQVARYSANAPARAVTSEDVMTGRVDAESLVRWVAEQDAPPLVYSSADPAAVRAAQEAGGRKEVAEALETLFADLAAKLRAQGYTRIVVAGGETSGAVVSALKPQAILVGPRAAAGVPLLSVAGDPPYALALKSGNFGGPDFFAEALALMEGGA